MLKRLIIFGIILWGLGLVRGIAQTDRMPVAALTFTFNGQTHVAVFDENGILRVDVLPDFMLFGRYDIQTITPTWVTDGQLVGIGYDPMTAFEQEPVYDAPAIYLKHYDLVTGIFTAPDSPITSPLPVSEDGWRAPQILTINSLSPDETYATLTDTMQATGYIVNLTTNDTVFSLDCPFKALHWQPDRVLIGSHGLPDEDCPPLLMWVDVTTGDILTDLSASIADQQIFRFNHAVPINDDQVLVTTYDSISVIENETYQRLYTVDGALLIAPDESGFVFDDGSNWSYLPLVSPFIAESLIESSQSQLNRITFSTTGAVILGTEQRIDSTVTLGRTIYTPSDGSYQMDILYQNDNSPHRLAFSPDLAYVAILNNAQLRVFDAMASDVWNDTGSEVALDMTNEAILYWADNQHIVTELEDYTGSLVSNIEADIAILPPETGAH